jgi:hypothetical protein
VVIPVPLVKQYPLLDTGRRHIQVDNDLPVSVRLCGNGGQLDGV